MRAVVNRGGRLIVDSVADPVAGPGQVLVRTLACGICGSDLHAVPPQPPPGASDRPDVVMGHEFVAEVVDYGPEAERRLSPGTRVVCMPFVPHHGRTVLIGYSPELPGGFGELMLLPESMLLEVPASLETELAALTEPLAVGLHAVGRAGLVGGESALVIGCGPVGLAVIAALRLRGVSPIVASDYSPARRALAGHFGAHRLIDRAEQDPFAAYLRAGGSAPGLIFECVGVPGLIQQLIDGAAPETRIVVVGVATGEDTFRPATAITKQLSLHFTLGYTQEEFAETLSALARGQLDAKPLITGRVGLDGVAAAFETLANPDQHAKIMVFPKGTAGQ